MQNYTDTDHGLPSKRNKKARGEPKPRKKRSREDADSGDEDVMAGSYEAKRPREAAKTAEQIRMEMVERENAREEAKAILKSIMLLSAGKPFSCSPCVFPCL